MLRRTLGVKRDEVTGGWRKLYTEKPNDLYSSPNVVRVIKSGRGRSVGHAKCIWDGRGVCRVLVVKPEGKRPFGRTKRR